MSCKLAVGVDIVEIIRIKSAFEEFGNRFLKHVYTETEIERYRSSIPSLAARFAGKEAVVKVLYPGSAVLPLTSIEILSDDECRPYILLHGEALERSRQIGIGELSISLSHCEEYAIAFAAGEVQVIR